MIFMVALSVTPNCFIPAEFESIYKRLKVTLQARGESFYQPLMQGVVDDLMAKGEK